jgi:hypothetical protein
LTDKEMKKEWVRMCKAFIVMIAVFFLTIIDNILTMGESAQGEEGADQPHPHPGSLLEEMGCGDEKSRDSRLCQGVSAVVVGCDCQRGW